VTEWTSTQSNPASPPWPPPTVVVGDPGDVVVGDGSGTVPPALIRRDGPIEGERFDRALATAAWPIWADTAAPSACTASVSRRRPARPRPRAPRSAVGPPVGETAR